MKFSTALPIVLLYSSCCAALETPQKRDSSTCSLGIARWIGSTIWDLTVYNTAQADRQDTNVISTLKNQPMDKGQSITVSSGVPNAITITNVDNAPVFDYDEAVLVAPLDGVGNGLTKVDLSFEIKDTGVNWTTADCGAGNTIFSAGIESWSCDFACELTSAKEL